MSNSKIYSTGLPGLDQVLHGLISGDNIVWKVNSIEHYQFFVEPFCSAAKAANKKLVYFHFDQHQSLIPDDIGAEVHQLYPEEGFEEFITRTHQVIETNGADVYYVFDSLSVLSITAFSDRMVGNFFMLTCPYILEKGAIAYFAILRNKHSHHAAYPIAQTTQVLLDVHHHQGKIYIHPQKVEKRYSPTIFMLHVLEGDQFIPITFSAIVSEVLSSVSTGLETANFQMGLWNRRFLQAEDMLEAYHREEIPEQKLKAIFDQLLCMLLYKENRLYELAQRYFTLSDLINIRKRMIGTGFIGGKSIGMLLAHAILRKNSPRLFELLETHDSFYIGSEVFYTFLVINGCWWVRKKQQDPETFLDSTERACTCIQNGIFPEYIIQRFLNMLDYFGQSPIIVRSSSLLEDNFGNTFAGRYVSIFCANQGSREQRLKEFTDAVRTIYASSMSEKALTYRAQRGLLDQDEQMALLVQRVSGVRYGNLFYPQLSGVGYSYNPFAWSGSIDPHAGMLRLVFGLGTRAVERVDDDYTRIIALSAPTLRPESQPAEIRRYTQRKADVLHLQENKLHSDLLPDIFNASQGLPEELFLSPDEELERLANEMELKSQDTNILSFEYILHKTTFIQDMKEILRILHDAYDHPIDIEFTANFLNENQYKLGLLQCRPFQIKGSGMVKEPPASLKQEDIILQCKGTLLGSSRVFPLDRIIYVSPSIYGHLPLTERYSIARLIGNLTRWNQQTKKQTLLIGPGRWGTTTPSLGVPVSFAEISAASVICEIEAMRDDLIPDVSLGTHFYSNLVELDMMYLAILPGKDGNFVNDEFLMNQPNRLTEILPNAAPFASCLRVLEVSDPANDYTVQFNSNIIQQTAICYREKKRTN
ncbi:MAG: PEP/pyruvate-binding domain-containing protein [bacterium]|jgi:pyruvate,water dikinase